MRQRSFIVMSGTIVILLGLGLPLLMAADWLGQCDEGTFPPNVVTPETVPHQMCLGLTDCDPAITSTACVTSYSSCPDNPSIATVATQLREIDYGDCTFASIDDNCIECQGLGLICAVTYQYEDKSGGQCLRRCLTPSFTAKTDANRCRP